MRRTRLAVMTAGVAVAAAVAVPTAIALASSGPSSASTVAATAAKPPPPPKPPKCAYPPGGSALDMKADPDHAPSAKLVRFKGTLYINKKDCGLPGEQVGLYMWRDPTNPNNPYGTYTLVATGTTDDKGHYEIVYTVTQTAWFQVRFDGSANGQATASVPDQVVIGKP